MLLPPVTGEPVGTPASQYLFQCESSDIRCVVLIGGLRVIDSHRPTTYEYQPLLCAQLCSRLRVDVQSLGFVSTVTPGGMVRLVHAIMRSFLVAFKVRVLRAGLSGSTTAARQRA